MGLTETQGFLAQLYTNSQLRTGFFNNPKSVGKDLGLTPEEIEQLSQLSVDQVNLFAVSLQRKRFGEVRDLLPLTFQLLKKEMKELFWPYTESYLPQGIRKHQEDAIAFASYLQKNFRRSDFIHDVIKYEKLWIIMNNPQQKLLISCFNYDIIKLIESLRKKHDNPVLITRKTMIICWRLSVNSHLKFAVRYFC